VTRRPPDAARCAGCRQAEIHLLPPKYGPGARNRPSESSSTTKFSSNGASPAIRILPPSASLMAAPGPAVCAAFADPDRRSRQSRPWWRRCGPTRAACPVRVGIAGRRRIVLRVGNHDRLARARCQLHRVAHGPRRARKCGREIASCSRSARRWCQPRRRHRGCGHRRIRSRRNRESAAGNPRERTASATASLCSAASFW